MSDAINVEKIFGEDVFGDSAMKERLPKNVYKELRKVIDEGAELSLVVADVVANAMKNWALEKGATHYTHWFQPLTGVTAEKHDSFISAPDANGKVLMEFSGKELIKGEPDASSFPSGGLRATFEARGYTAWDCTSPAFIKRSSTGATLCIPTAFCSYTGEALDKKTPLLRSMQAINTQALRILRLFGNTTSKKVTPSVGSEQEYFLVDRDKPFVSFSKTGKEGYHARGCVFFNPEYGIRLGDPAELAPIYAEANLAVDQNQITMEAMKRIANNHGMVCLLHEKPFEGVNGSGKHNNWSLTTDDGINMLDPGKTPHENKQFLLVLTAIMAAVDDHADLLRESAASVGNDHRLGANEAPPAIISMFLGDQLEDVVEQLVVSGDATSSKKAEKMHMGVSTIPNFKKDATDRNRTSPFAFTGNKFEFRSLGSSASVASPNVVLNTIVAESFSYIADELEKADDFELAVHDLIKKLATKHSRIIFNGDGYSDEWVEEAKRRGLPNIKTMVDAIPALTTDKSIALFEKFHVFTRAELESRAEVQYEAYSKAINIEARAMIDIAGKQIIPAAIKATTQLANSVNTVKSACADADVSTQSDLLLEISGLLADTRKALEHLRVVTEEASNKNVGVERATYFKDVVTVAMTDLRTPVDKLEMIVDKDLWPMPSYGDLIFEV